MARRNDGRAAGSRLNVFYLILGVIAVIGVAGLIYAVTRSSRERAATEPVPVPGADNPQQLVAQARGVSMGPDGAPAQIIEFGDFQCPGCRVFALQVKPILKQRYIDTGRAQFVYYDFPLPMHQHAFLAARATRCAEEQGRYWQYHDAVFARQSSWSTERNALGTFVEIAVEVGLDRGAFESCINSDKYADLVSYNQKLGERLGVSGTPTVFVNGKRIEDWDPDAIGKVIEGSM